MVARPTFDKHNQAAYGNTKVNRMRKHGSSLCCEEYQKASGGSFVDNIIHDAALALLKLGQDSQQ